jgi:ceramide glucosyltransferase
VSVLKPLRGVDAGMYEAFASHARQKYSGEYELIFGAAPGDSGAKDAVLRLQAEFPECAIRFVECAEMLGPNGKVSTLVQMLPAARHDFILINDSDIFAGPEYLARVMACFADEKAGMVTAIYSGHCVADAGGKIPVWAKLEALTVSTEFVPGAILAMQLDGAVKFALGGTLAIRREVLEKIGGLAPLVNYLADDYEMGVRTIAAGYRVAMAPETVATGVPDYRWREYAAHQLRWLRTVRDARPWGYAGLPATFGLLWAAVTVIASAGALWSWALLSLSLLARIALALSVGVGILGDRQVVRDVWLVPLRDFVGAVLWFWSFGGDDVEWRGIKFRLNKGKLERV